MWTSERPADETDCYPGVWPPHRGTTAATTGENSCRRPAGVVDVCQLATMRRYMQRYPNGQQYTNFQRYVDANSEF